MIDSEKIVEEIKIYLKINDIPIIEGAEDLIKICVRRTIKIINEREAT